MKLFIIFGVLSLYHVEGKANWDTVDKYHQLVKSQEELYWKPCAYESDVFLDFRQSLYNVTTETFKKISTASKHHFVFSPYSFWLTLGAIAEGTSGPAREELLTFLHLPHDECLRQQFFQLATSLESSGEDVTLSRSSMLILDDSLTLKSYWENFIRTKTFLKTSSAPIKSDPVGAASLIRKVMKLQLPAPNFIGNSIIVDTLDFEGLWTEAFSNSIIEHAPFCDNEGKKIGYVDLMKIKRRVKMAYIPSMNSKVLELPVGHEGRYRMVFALNVGGAEVKNTIPAIMNSAFLDILGNMKESIVPLEVAIPRFKMTTEIDMRNIMESLGVKNLWSAAESGGNISDPAACPSSFIQRSTVTFDSTGIRAPIQEVSNIVPESLKTWATEETGLDPILGKDFIIDRPFMFGLFDSKTYTCLFAATFSTPTYKL